MGEEFQMRVEEPPASKTGTAGKVRRTETILAFLHANPGKWCRVHEASGKKAQQSLASQVRAWRKRAKFAGCEFATRAEDGKGVLYARYTPPAESAPPECPRGVPYHGAAPEAA